MHRTQNVPGARRCFSLLAVLVAACLFTAPVAMAEPGPLGPNYDAQGQVEPALDALILRPLGLLMTVTGFVTFVAYSPIIAITRPTDIAQPFKSLVVAPARYTWVDPLGYHPEPLL